MTRFGSRRLLGWALVGALVSACEAEDGSFGAEPEFTHDRDLQPIWTERCAPCHVGGSSFGLLWLDEGFAWENIVEAPAQQQPKMLRIDPGSPETSYLWRKLNGTHLEVGGYGERIPVNLDPDQMAMIETWILEGAPR